MELGCIILPATDGDSENQRREVYCPRPQACMRQKWDTDPDLLSFSAAAIRSCIDQLSLHAVESVAEWMAMAFVLSTV